MENDVIEELFRKKAEENLNQEKPREVVWKKIESNLNEKKHIPKQHFIQSVWFSAAVFALIAVPYFYFFIENLNNKEKQSMLVDTKLPNLLPESSKATTPVLDSVLLQNANEIVHHDVKDNSKSKSLEPLSTKQINKDLRTTEIKQDKLLVANDTIMAASAKLEIDPTALETFFAKSEEKDTVLIVANTTAKAPTMAKAMMKNDLDLAENQNQPVQNRKIEPIQISRNRFVLQDKVNRVGFNFIKKVNNKLIFENTALRISIIRENGVVKIVANPNKINKEVLALLQNNKEYIYNYYINFDRPAK